MTDHGGGGDHGAGHGDHAAGGHEEHKHLSLVERVEEFRKRGDEVQDDLETQRNIVSEAYLSAAKQHLAHATKKDAYAPSKLRKKEVQLAMAKSIKDFIIKKHTSRGRGEVKDELYAQQLMNFYTGATEQDFANMMEKHKSGYTLDTHKKGFEERVMERLGEIGQHHMESALGGEEYHLDNLKFMGLEKNKDQIPHKVGLNELLKYISTIAGGEKYEALKGKSDSHGHH